MLMMVVDNKVAHMIQSVKVAKFIDDELRSGRMIFVEI
jgi:hypothetical protein